MEQQKPFVPRGDQDAPAPLRLAEALVAGIPPADLARALHRQESWVRQHRALVSPAAHVLFASGRLRSVSAYARLRRLPPQARRRLLDAGGLITVARCAQALPPTRVPGRRDGGAL
ncbi:MAG: hypothetical protein ACYCRH_03395 [Acidiferrobacteraceae bacterium]